MQIVIDIPEETYKRIKLDYEYDARRMTNYEKIIANGISLPNGHGRLIDAEYFDDTLSDGVLNARKQRKYVLESAINTIRGNLANAPTIIEADKE